MIEPETWKKVEASLARYECLALLNKRLIDGVQELIRVIATDYGFDPSKLSDAEHARLSTEAFDLIDNWEMAVEKSGGKLRPSNPLQHRLTRLSWLSDRVIDLELAIMGAIPPTR